MSKKSYDVFISYRRDKGADIARNLQLALTALGFKVYFDLEELTDGKFNEELYKAIKQSQNVIFLMTEGALERCSNEGDWIRKELEYTIDQHINLIPVAPTGTPLSFPEKLPQKLEPLKNLEISELHLEKLFNESVAKIADRFKNVNISNRIGKYFVIFLLTIIAGLVWILLVSHLIFTKFSNWKIILEWSVIFLLVFINCIIWFFPIFKSTFLKVLIGLFSGSFAYFVLPIFFPPPIIDTIPGTKTPDQIIVDHPLPTIESHCLNNKHWWRTAASIDTCYGKWEMQRNKVLGIFRIVDPRNISRSWGTQKMMISVFEKIKPELEKNCPISASPTSLTPLSSSERGTAKDSQENQFDDDGTQYP